MYCMKCHHCAHIFENIWPSRLLCLCFPSQQTIQYSPAMPSVQPLLVSGTVYHCPFEQRHLSTHSDDTWRLTGICSSPSLLLTNKPYHPRLRFESCLTYGALQMLFTYLLVYLLILCSSSVCCRQFNSLMWLSLCVQRVTYIILHCSLGFTCPLARWQRSTWSSFDSIRAPHLMSEDISSNSCITCEKFSAFSFAVYLLVLQCFDATCCAVVILNIICC